MPARGHISLGSIVPGNRGDRDVPSWFGCHRSAARVVVIVHLEVDLKQGRRIERGKRVAVGESLSSVRKLDYKEAPILCERDVLEEVVIALRGTVVGVGSAFLNGEGGVSVAEASRNGFPLVREVHAHDLGGARARPAVEADPGVGARIEGDGNAQCGTCVRCIARAGVCW